MDLNRLVAELGLAESRELLRVGWERSQQSMPTAEVPFLSRPFVTDACRGVPLPPDVVDRAAAVSQRVAADAALRALAWHYHCCLFRHAGYPWGNIGRWPSPTAILKNDAGMFHLLVLLSGLPGMQAIYQAHSVPPQIARDTLSQLEFAMTEYREEHGTWGLTAHNVRWFMNHFCGKLFGLGRLQFQFGFFGHRLRAFRHTTSGRVVALCEGGTGYLADGQLDGLERVHDATGAWPSQLTFADDGVIGHPILPTGRALRREVHLPKQQWRPVLAPGDPVLNIHIPGGGPMTHERSGESFAAALEFVPRHFPDRPFAGFCCSSWILDAQLEELLPPTSNLVRFQHEVYLFPVLSNDRALLNAAFGGVPADLTEAPRDTTLRRALADRLLGGGHLRARAGGCFLLPEDFDWGTQVYRRQAFPF